MLDRRWWPALALSLTACATASPRFSQEVAATFAQDEMRHLVTPELEVYYPAAHREAALRTAARAAECLRALRAREKTQRPRDRALLFLTRANYNNAYVSGQQLGEPLHSLIPLFTTDETSFAWNAMDNADSGDIACHEMFHFVHFEQVENFWRAVNAVFGPVWPQQAMIERWFTEGVAQYYEGRIRKPVGRPASPLYRGLFSAFAATRDRGLWGSDLSTWQRELAPYSGAYLTSLHFTEWLVETHGEDKLWEVMDRQGRSFFSPLGVTLRFKAVYGRSIGALLDDFSEHLAKTLPKRDRPPEQRVLRRGLGQQARLASHPASGTLAVLTAGADEGPRLRILERDGQVRVERTLVQLTPSREWVLCSPASLTGLSFSADGRFLFLANDDFVPSGETSGQLWKLDASDGRVVKVLQGVGPLRGGAVHPGGAVYTAVRFGPGRATLVDVDLETGRQTELLSPGATVGALDWSPDGTRLVFSRLDGNGWNLVLLENGATRALTVDGASNYGARWADADHLVFARSAGGRLQVHRLEVSSARLERLTDAPWALVDPAPLGDQVAFVNRDGVEWTLDVAPLRPREVVRDATPSLVAQADAAQADEDAPEATGVEPSPAPLPTATDAAPAPEGSAMAGPAAPAPALSIETDEPASALDHLFVPTLRLPGVLVAARGDSQGNLSVLTTLSASLSGRDRLSLHNWAINGSLVLPTYENSLSLEYRNQQLAPWQLAVFAGRDGYADEAFWGASVGAGRTVYLQPVSFALQALVHQPFGAPVERFIGPSLSASFGAGEGTAYGGTQRAFSMGLDVAAYPRGLGSSIDLLDVSAGVSAAIPLPLLKRQSFVVGLTGRALAGAPEGALRVGGVSRGTTLWMSQPPGWPPSPGAFLPGSMVEAVRGYDDYAVRATAVAIGTARYRYHFIIDRGFSSTVYLLPSLMLRQIDVEAFGSAAVTNNRAATWARAAGGAVSVRAVLGGVFPFSISYQLAARFDFGLQPLHVVGLAFD